MKVMDGGNGDASRLDRIEATLDRVGERLDKIATMGYLHEERIARIEALHEENELRWKENELRWNQFREEQRDRDRVIDLRIEKLVIAIGELLRLREAGPIQ
jgi:hypothetical protein